MRRPAYSLSAINFSSMTRKIDADNQISLRNYYRIADNLLKQVMLPEAIATVMAPTDSSSPHGIFHLSNPGGVATIQNCQQRGFHPHEEPEDGSPIYEHCFHVYMNLNVKFDVVDLR